MVGIKRIEVYNIRLKMALKTKAIFPNFLEVSCLVSFFASNPLELGLFSVNYFSVLISPLNFESFLTENL